MVTTSNLDRFRLTQVEIVIPYVMFVVDCIDCVCFGGVPASPYILGRQSYKVGYMESWFEYNPSSFVQVIPKITRS